MELRLLNYFLMVSQEENITKAAQLLHVTQPTLSRQLMQLEDELGVKLFERSNHSIVLTSDGLLLKRRAQEIVSLAEKTKRELTTEKELSGEIEIGSGEFKSFSLLADVIAAFSEKHPGKRKLKAEISLLVMPFRMATARICVPFCVISMGAS